MFLYKQCFAVLAVKLQHISHCQRYFLIVDNFLILVMIFFNIVYLNNVVLF